VRPALLFDLDDTLVVEEPAAQAAFEATARFAATRYDVQVTELTSSVRLRARELWYSAPTHPYCMRVGISSWEGLWCRFDGQEPEIRALRAWSPAYRREAWTLALADQGVRDNELAEELGERFGLERRARHEIFEDATGALAAAGETYALALVTNGASCLQREKLAASGLDEHFNVVVVSAELGTAKPDATIFQHALSLLGSDAKHAVMVGDSLSRDVYGAIAAGLGGVWLNRHKRSRPDDRTDLVEVSTLSDLSAALESLA
jgi:putative hydrolase of the HAD superfamily